MNIATVFDEKIVNELKTNLQFSNLQIKHINSIEPELVEIFWCSVYPKIDKSFLDRYKNLRIIISPTTGLTHIDIEYCQKKKIKIISLKGESEFLSSITATAEFTWTMLLALWRNLPLISNCDELVENRWNFKSNQLLGKNIGIVGLGRVGAQVANYALAFGCNVFYYDPYVSVQFENFQKKAKLNNLIENSDIICICASVLDKSSPPIFGNEEISFMRTNAILINTARGELLDEKSAFIALLEGRISGLGLDVRKEELSQNRSSENLIKLCKENSLNLLITPHVAGACSDALSMCNEFLFRKLITEIESG